MVNILSRTPAHCCRRSHFKQDMKRFIYAMLFFVVFHPQTIQSQIAQGHLNDFQNGSLQDWREGAASPNPPLIVIMDGSEGINDAFLRNISSGESGPGGKCYV